MHSWNQEFVATSPEGRRYEAIATEIERALRFMAACGIDLMSERRLHEVDVWTSHEGLLLDYEEGLTRRDSLTGEWYDCSAHMLWVGDRTREADGAHVEFFSGVRNPLGLKVGPTATADDLVDTCERLDPERTPGRLTLIARMGAGRVQDELPPLISGGPRGRASGRVGMRPDARQRVSHRVRLQDAPVRGHHVRDLRLLRGVPRRGGRGRAACISSSPART